MRSTVFIGFPVSVSCRPTLVRYRPICMVQSRYDFMGQFAVAATCIWTCARPSRRALAEPGNCCSPPCATPCGPAGWRPDQCCRRHAAWRPTSDWPATRWPRPTPNWSPRAGCASRQGAGTWVLNAGGARDTRAAPRRARGTRPQPDARLAGRVGVSAHRMGWPPPARALANAPTEALRMGDPRGQARASCDALAEYLAQGLRRAHIGGVDRRSAPVSAMRSNCSRASFADAARSPLEAYGLFIFRDALAALDVPTVPIGRRRTRRGGRRLDGLDDARRAADTGPPQPARDAAASVAAHRRRRLGAAHRRLCLRRRLRRRVPLRPPTDRRAAGAVSRTGWLYLGSASKSLSQALRLGWMVVPDDLIDAVIDAAGGRSSSTSTRSVAADHGRLHHQRAATTSTSGGCGCATAGGATPLVDALSGFDVGISGLSAGVNIAADPARRRASTKCCDGRARPESRCRACRSMRHPLAGREVSRSRRDHRRFRRTRRPRVHLAAAWCAIRRPESPPAWQGSPL